MWNLFFMASVGASASLMSPSAPRISRQTKKKSRKCRVSQLKWTVNNKSGSRLNKCEMLGFRSGCAWIEVQLLFFWSETYSKISRKLCKILHLLYGFYLNHNQQKCIKIEQSIIKQANSNISILFLTRSTKILKSIKIIPLIINNFIAIWSYMMEIIRTMFRCDNSIYSVNCT